MAASQGARDEAQDGAPGRFDARGSLRAALHGMRGYEPIAPPEEVAARYGIASDGISPDGIVKLDGNENPYGPSPRARAALAAPYEVHRYPDPDQRRLRAALADRLGVEAGSIVAGAGADELIDLVFRAYVEPGDAVVVASPTFGMYAFDAELHGARLVDVPRRATDWELDEDALVEAAAAAKVVFIPSPNNPTGNPLPPATAERLLDTGALVVVDEAYIEFSHGASAASLVRRAADGEPLIVLRTFSKWAGLAGLRVGYGVMPPAIAEVFMQVKQPYGVNVAAEAAALASLEDAALLDERACEIAGERDRMAEALAATGCFEPSPSEANFVLCRLSGTLAGVPGDAVQEALRRRGVFVRHFGDQRLSQHLRISAGTPQDTARLLAAVGEVRTEVGAEPDEEQP